jgi:6-phosphogluconolactonase
LVDADTFTRWESGQAMTQYAYVGTNTQTGKTGKHRKEGIYLYSRNQETGQLTLVGGQVSKEDPTFLRMHPNKKFLYAVVELVEGGVSSFAVNSADGSLTLLNSQPTGAIHPCHLNYDPSGKFVLVSNYTSGRLAIFPILADGTLAAMSDFVDHLGSGPRKQQERAHAHSMAFDPSGKFLLAADLGLDRIFVYHLDPISGKLSLHALGGATMTPGAGPRHFVFHANGKILYSANELDSSVTVCTWDDQKGILAPVQTVPTLPADFSGFNGVADIHLHPSGKVLYVSNRGHNSLAVFTVLADGSLAPVGHVSCGGNWPRNFAVDPSGRWLYVANQRSSNLATYKLNPENGWPELIDNTIEVSNPNCIELAEL